MTVDAIKAAILQLPESERDALASWLNNLNYDDWDRQMAADFSKGGRGMALVEQVQREIAAGNARPIKGRCGSETRKQEVPSASLSDAPLHWGQE